MKQKKLNRKLKRIKMFLWDNHADFVEARNDLDRRIRILGGDNFTLERKVKELHDVVIKLADIVEKNNFVKQVSATKRKGK